MKFNQIIYAHYSTVTGNKDDLGRNDIVRMLKLSRGKGFDAESLLVFEHQSSRPGVEGCENYFLDTHRGVSSRINGWIKTNIVGERPGPRTYRSEFYPESQVHELFEWAASEPRFVLLNPMMKGYVIDFVAGRMTAPGAEKEVDAQSLLERRRSINHLYGSW
tara:strand:+ start:7700 stop:8185 length:486 start_codon:yes stop_codon:yes gene_type:complete